MSQLSWELKWGKSFVILLTRPYKDSLEIAQKLGEENCLIEPMMEIEQLEIDLSNYIKTAIQAIVVTSKNVTPPNLSPLKGGIEGEDIKIPEHGKNAKEILSYCLENLLPEAGKILYLCGNNITLDIADELKKNGFDAEKVVTYNQIPIEKFSDEFLSKFDKIKIASFFSKQTLRNFLELAQKYNLNLKNIICICISENVSRETLPNIWKEIKIAKEPNLDGMLELI